MKLKLKRLTSLFLCLVMVASMLPVGALAANGITRPSNLNTNLVVGILRDARTNDQEVFPNEPNVNEYDYYYLESDYGLNTYAWWTPFSSNAGTFIDIDKFWSDDRTVPNEANNVFGIYNPNGIDLSSDPIRAGTLDGKIETIISNWMSAEGITGKTVSDYKLLAYVLKYENTGYSRGYHLDCKIVPVENKTLSYDANKPAGVTYDIHLPESVSVKSGTSVTVSDIGEKSFTYGGVKYTFTGWNTKPDGRGTGYSNNDTIAVTDDTVLYAQWQAAAVYTATVKTYLDGVQRDIPAIHSSDVTLLLSKDGTNFISLSDVGTGEYTAQITENGTYYLYHEEGAEGSREKHKLESHALVIYNANGTLDVHHYSVTHRPNGGAFSDSTTEPKTDHYYTGTSVTTMAAPTRAGYRFMGWKDQDNVIHPAGAAITVTEATTLTAQWKAPAKVNVEITLETQSAATAITPSMADEQQNRDFRVILTQRAAGSTGAYTEVHGSYADKTAAIPGDGSNVHLTYHDLFTNLAPEHEYSVNVEHLEHYALVSQSVTKTTGDADSSDTYTIQVTMRYLPLAFELPYEVVADDTVPHDYIPEAVDLKVTFWDGSKWITVDEHTDNSTPESTVDVGLGRDSTDAEKYKRGSGSHTVWGFYDNGDPYYYRVEVVGIDLVGDTTLPVTETAAETVYNAYPYQATVSVEGEGGTPDGADVPGAYATKTDAEPPVITRHGSIKILIQMNSYDVTFQANGGTVNGYATQRVENLYQIPDLTQYVPVRSSGYVFDGWYIDLNGNGALDSAELAQSNQAQSNAWLAGDITLIAHWKDPLTIRGTVTIAGTYQQDGHTIDIPAPERAAEAEVFLKVAGESGVVDIREISFGSYTTQGSAVYEFLAIPNEGKTYEIEVRVLNYTSAYDNNADDVFTAGEYTAVFGGSTEAVVDADLDFVPDSFEQKIVVDASQIGEGFRPTGVLATISDRDYNSTSSYQVISQHQVSPYGVAIGLGVGATGEGTESVWKYRYDGTRYIYRTDLTKLYGNVGGVFAADGSIAYSGAASPYIIAYSEPTVWDTVNGNVTGGAKDGSGNYTGILTATLIPRTYGITFDLNLPGGVTTVTGMDAFQTVVGGHVDYAADYRWSISKSITAKPDCAGYVFTGWEKDSALYDADGEFTVSAGTTGSFTLKATWAADINDDDVADLYQKKITFAVENGAWNDGTTEDKVAWVTLLKEGVPSADGSAAFPNSETPAAGSMPDAGYQNDGQWDTVPFPGTVNGTAPVTYVFTYAPRTDLTYTVRYLQQGSNTPLKDAKTVNATFGNSVTENAVELPGYNKVEPTSQTITIGADSVQNVITFYYTPRTDLTLTVRYRELDNETTPLIPDKTLTNMTMGTPVSIPALQVSIPGYAYVSASNASYTIKATGNVITLYYKKAAVGYTVEYYYDGVRDDTATVDNTDAVYQSVINTYTAKEKTGYALDRVENLPLTIHADKSMNVIRVYYAPDSGDDGTPDEYQVTVTYTVANGTWSDGTNTPITETFALKEWDNVHLCWVDKTPTPTLGGSIPTGMIRADGYEPESGRWDEPIAAGTPVTTSVTYNYRFHDLNEYDIVIRVVNGTVTVAGTASAEYNATVVHSSTASTGFSVQANAGYVLESVMVDGASADVIPSGPLAHTRDHAIVVTYGRDTDGDGTADSQQRKVTFKVVNGQWNDGTSEDKVDYVSHIAGDKNIYKLTEVPAVGVRPNTGYTAGSWYPVPAAGTAVNGGEVYTYTYARKSYEIAIGVTGGTSFPAPSVAQFFHDAGKQTTITFTPYPNHILDGVTINGSPEATGVLTPIGGGQYTYTYSHTANLSIHVAFVADLNGDSIPDELQRKVTFQVENGTWGDGTTDDIIEYIEANHHSIYSLREPTSVIPAVGNNPYQGFKAGSWAPALPDANTSVTDGAVYTYTYAPIVVTPVTIPYYVEHYKQLSDGTYSATPSETEIKFLSYHLLDGVVDEGSYAPVLTGGQIVAASKDYGEHYTYDGDAPGTVKVLDVSVNTSADPQVVVLSNHSTMKLYYTIHKHTIRYELDGGTASYGFDYSDQTVYHGAGVTVKPAPNKTGYTFDHWYVDTNGNGQLDAGEVTDENKYVPGHTMFITKDMTLIARWQLRSDLSYTVNYREKGSNVLISSVAENPKIVTGQSFGAAISSSDHRIDIPHYTYDSANTDSIILGMESTLNVISLYYTKNTYDYTVEYYYDDVKDDTKTESASAPYGSTITGYTDKVKDGYELDRVEPTVLAIDTPDKVMKVYYKRIPTAAVTFLVENGTWDGTDAGAKTVTVRLAHGQGFLRAADIPDVSAAQPNGGYEGGTWKDNNIPHTGTAITGDTTFTYTFSRQGSGGGDGGGEQPQPTTGSALLTKVDSADRDTKLANVEFELYKAGSTDLRTGSYTTNAGGQITVNDLAPGSYYWLETKPAEGYKLDDTKHFFTVSAGQTAKLTVTNTRTAVPGVFSGDHYAYINGFPDGLVHPEANITRAQVATIFFRLLTENVRNENLTTVNRFSDVEEGMWFNTAVSTMAAMGIINGYPDGTFRPNAPIKRAEFAAIAARFEENGNTTDASFGDVYGHWAQKEVNIAANNGWILGYENGTFQPDRHIIRAEAMALVNRVLQRIPEQHSELLPGMIVWPDNNDTSKWYYLTVQEATNSHDYTRKSNGYEQWTQLEENPDWNALER